MSLLQHVTACVIAHFDGYRKRTAWAFCWRITLEGIAVSLAAAVVCAALFGSPGRHFPFSIPVLLLVLLVAAPVLETLFLQALPVFFARLCNARFPVQIVASVVPFALLHAPAGVAAGVAAGLAGGFLSCVHLRALASDVSVVCFLDYSGLPRYAERQRHASHHPDRHRDLSAGIQH